MTVFLDTGPLGILTNPKRPPETVAAIQWAVALMQEGHRLIVPSIADFEVRRELIRAGKQQGIVALDSWNQASEDRYLPLTDSALRLAASLWAQVRNAGTATSDPKALDCDVLIASQAIDMGLPQADFIIATVNVGHLALFAPAALWSQIQA